MKQPKKKKKDDKIKKVVKSDLGNDINKGNDIGGKTMEDGRL